MNNKDNLLELSKQLQFLNLKLENNNITKSEILEIGREIKTITSKMKDLKKNQQKQQKPIDIIVEEKTKKEKDIENFILMLDKIEEYMLICLEESNDADFCKKCVKAVNKIDSVKQIF